MKIKIKLGLLLIIAFVVVVGLFLYNSYNYFNIHENFTSVPLSFNPENSISRFDWNGAVVKFQGGFVKGKIIDDNKVENLVLRSLSPIPIIALKGSPDADKTYYIRVENVNPVNIKVKSTKVDKQEIIDYHTLLIVLNLRRSEDRTVELTPNTNVGYTEFVILGDNRNGYQTFSKIIEQINAINPVFVVDNGDLVYGGEPNKYRLFYETVSKLRVPLYTTLGNHDIRESGRPIYTKLFGPPYYSFDYGNGHFVFLDSSRGWAEKHAISEEQYIWLENDLKSASGKRIFVITHIPPTDPRGTIEPNKLPDEPGVEKTSFFEKLMNNYSAYKGRDHGFPDRKEAEKFESIMSKYKVDTVFLSHIHSYFSYIKGNVRYVISGGAGAELLTSDSYYHYLRVKITNVDHFIEMVQLPSPANTIQDRYIAAIGLFANSILKEYNTRVIFISSLLVFAILWFLYSTRKKWWYFLCFICGLFIEVLSFAVKRYKERRSGII